MKYESTLIAVKDIERSKQFYQTVCDQEVILDFGSNITMSGGFSLQQDYDVLADLPEKSMIMKSHSMELYFETEDFDALMERLHTFPSITYVHPVKKYDWQQRVIRFYDPDGHIIEVGEAMHVIIRKLLEAGKTMEETAQITQHPIDMIQQIEKEL